MTENLAGRGEGLAGLVAPLLDDIERVFCGCDTMRGHTCQIHGKVSVIRRALEAPAGTAPTKAEQALCEAALVWFLTPEVLDDYEALQDSESASAPAEFLLLCEIAKDVLKERIAKTESK